MRSLLRARSESGRGAPTAGGCFMTTRWEPTIGAVLVGGEGPRFRTPGGAAMTVAVMGSWLAATACGTGRVCDVDGVAVGAYQIDSQDDIDALAGCTTIEGGLAVTMSRPRYFLEEEGPPYTSLVGLESLTTVEGELWIAQSPLVDLCGLDGLREVGKAMVIAWNPSLRSLGGLEGLSFSGDNPPWQGSYLSPTPPDELRFQGENGLRVVGNPALTEVDALGALTRVRGGVGVRANDALEHLNGLAALEEIGGELDIQLNAALRDITALSAVSSLGSELSAPGWELVIQNNIVLAQCQADALANQLGMTCNCGGNDESGVCE